MHSDTIKENFLRKENRYDYLLNQNVNLFSKQIEIKINNLKVSYK